MCSDYEEMLQYAFDQGVQVIEYDFDGELGGYYCDGYIFIDKFASETDKIALLAEEIGHYYTATEDITQTDTIAKLKQEQQGRRWAIQKLVSFGDIVESIIKGSNNLYDVADDLSLPIEFLNEAIAYYHGKYGCNFDYDGYTVILSGNSIIVHPALWEQ